MADGSVKIDIKLDDSKAKSQASKSGKEISKNLENGMKGASTAAKNTESQIKSSMSGAASSSKSSFADVGSAAKSNFGNVGDAAKSASSDASSSFKSVASDSASSFSEVGDKAKSGFGGVSDAAHQVSEDATDTFAGVFPNAAGVAAAAAAALATAVAAIATQAVQVGMEFDKSMSQVAATMGVTVDEIGELRDFAQEMGAQTAFSSTQAADALNYMALAGYNAETSMEMLPSVLNLAAAGNMDLATASDMVTDSQTALGLSLDQTKTMIDQMAKTSSMANADVQQLGEATLTVGGTAKNLAGGTKELNQVLGVLADNSIKGSEGGTALRNIILSLSAPTDKARAKIEELGVSVFDAEGKMRPLPEIMQDFNASMEPLTQEQKTQALNEIFNKVDLKSVNALLGTSAERFNNLANGIENSAGAAEKMKETQLDNLAGDVTILQSAAANLAIQIADVLNPALRSATQFMTNALMPAISALVANFGHIATAVVSFTATIAVMKLYNKVVTTMNTHTVQMGGYFNVLGKQVKLTGTAFNVATAASRAFSTALKALKAAAPMIAVTLAVEAVMALSDAFTKAQEHSRNFEKATSGLNDALKTNKAEVIATADSLNKLNTTKAQRNFTDLRKKIEENIEAQAKLADDINETWTNVEANSILVSNYTNVIASLTNKLDENGNKVSLNAEEQKNLTTAVAALNQLTGQSIEVIDSQNGVLSVSTEEIMKNADAWIENARAQAAQEKMVELAKQQIENEMALTAAKEARIAAEQKLRESEAAGLYNTDEQVNALERAKKAEEEAAALVDANSAKQKELADVINDTNSALLESSSSFKSYIQARKDWSDSLSAMSVDVDKFSDKLSELGFKTSDLTNLSSSELETLAASYNGTSEEIIAICDQLGIDVPQKLREAAQSAADAVEAPNDEMVQDFAESGAEAPNAMASGMNSSSGAPVSAADSISSKTASEMQSENSNAGTWGSHLVENFANGISSAISWVTNAASSVANAAASILGFSVPKKGIWSGAEKGGERSGRHLVENFAHGMLGAKSEIRDAADEIAETVNDSFDTIKSDWDSVIDTGSGMARGLMVYDRIDPAIQAMASMGAMMAMSSNSVTNNSTSNVVNINQPVKSPDEWARYMARIEHHGLAGKYV